MSSTTDAKTPAMSGDGAATRLNLSLADAVAAVLDTVVPLANDVVSLNAAHGRALSRDITSPIDLPLWDNAGMDGYAVRRRNVLGASADTPVTLPVRGTVVAGSDSRLTVNDGECVRIMTGAPMPSGADAVIRIEDTDHALEVVHIRHDRDAQLTSGNVRRRGEDVQAGALVFERGTAITAAHLAVLASIGVAEVPAHRAPRVALLSSGDELVMVDQFDRVLAGQRIVASSSYALPAQLAGAGATTRVMPVVPDTLNAVMRAMEDALNGGCDLLITTGGVSVGAHDYTREAIRQLGGVIAFWRARIRPGGPVGAGSVRGVPWIGLPGNPVSTMVTAELFARPAVRKLGGHRWLHRLPVAVRLTDAVKTSGTLTHLLRAIVTRAADGTLVARLAGGQGSNLMRTMAEANALLIVPEGQDGARPGAVLQALLIGDDPLATAHHPWSP